MAIFPRTRRGEVGGPAGPPYCRGPFFYLSTYQLTNYTILLSLCLPVSVYFQSPAGPGALAAAATGVGAHGAGPLTQARRLQVASGVIQLGKFFQVCQWGHGSHGNSAVFCWDAHVRPTGRFLSGNAQLTRHRRPPDMFFQS